MAQSLIHCRVEPTRKATNVACVHSSNSHIDTWYIESLQDSVLRLNGSYSYDKLNTDTSTL